MKKALFILLVSVLTCAAQTPAPTATDAAKAALTDDQWSLVNAALLEQRDALVAAHTSAIAEATAAQQQQVADLMSQLVAARAGQTRATAKLKVLVDGAKDALSKKTSEQRLAAGNALLAQVTASQTDEERTSLLRQHAEIAAKLKALTNAQAALKP